VNLDLGNKQLLGTDDPRNMVLPRRDGCNETAEAMDLSEEDIGST
jgi:hypothetical protein